MTVGIILSPVCQPQTFGFFPPATLPGSLHLTGHLLIGVLHSLFSKFCLMYWSSNGVFTLVQPDCALYTAGPVSVTHFKSPCTAISQKLDLLLRETLFTYNNNLTVKLTFRILKLLDHTIYWSQHLWSSLYTSITVNVSRMCYWSTM